MNLPCVSHLHEVEEINIILRNITGLMLRWETVHLHKGFFYAYRPLNAKGLE